MILIEHNGERLLVNSLDGHEGCKVIEQDVEEQPHDHCRRENGRWVEDTEAKAKAEHNARLMAMTRAELIDYILNLVASGEGRGGQ
jgi:hypothetical protein